MQRTDPESAHAAFLEAARLLREASAGTPVLELEWAVIQTLARDAANLFDDLPLVAAPQALVLVPRRWWQWRPGVSQVDQKFLTVHVGVDASAGSGDALVEITSFLLGRDGGLRVGMKFVPAKADDMTLRPGWMPPDDPRMKELFYWEAGHEAETLLMNEVEIEETERILAALERLAVLTRDRVSARLQRLHDREHL
jgi:hypothetical protein